jgi:hypothetical protein
MQFLVRNTFISATDDEEETPLFRSASEGHAVQNILLLPRARLEKSKELPRDAVGVDAVTEHPLKWLTPTPDSSPVHSPRELSPPMALQSYLLTQVQSSAVRDSGICLGSVWDDNPRVHEGSSRSTSVGSRGESYGDDAETLQGIAQGHRVPLEAYGDVGKAALAPDRHIGEDLPSAHPHLVEKMLQPVQSMSLLDAVASRTITGRQLLSGASMSREFADLVDPSGRPSPESRHATSASAASPTWIVPVPILEASSQSMMSLDATGPDVCSPLIMMATPPVPDCNMPPPWVKQCVSMEFQISPDKQCCEGLLAPMGLPFGQLHHFHGEALRCGTLKKERREFTKVSYMGRLSIISEDSVHTSGVHSYALQFTEGELSNADGVGFVFSPRLPCPQNIQKINSIFVNRAGRICMRANNEVTRLEVGIKPFELGEWIVVTVDLSACVATFAVWPNDDSCVSTATVYFGETLQKSKIMKACGHFACVVKNEVVVTLGS